MLQASIFDWYADNENEPACAFALQCTRSCSPGRVVCCQSGGFIASGEIAPERAPQVFVPRGLTPFGAEGFGEVQTPLQVARGSEADEVKLRPGDPVFFRPPKSGEIAEVNQATTHSSKPTTSLTQPTSYYTSSEVQRVPHHSWPVLRHLASNNIPRPGVCVLLIAANEYFVLGN